MEETADKPLSRNFRIPAVRKGSVKNNESDIVLLRRRLTELEKRVEDLEGS